MTLTLRGHFTRHAVCYSYHRPRILVMAMAAVGQLHCVRIRTDCVDGVDAIVARAHVNYLADARLRRLIGADDVTRPICRLGAAIHGALVASDGRGREAAVVRAAGGAAEVLDAVPCIPMGRGAACCRRARGLPHDRMDFLAGGLQKGPDDGERARRRPG